MEKPGLMLKSNINICNVQESDICQIAELEKLYFSSPWSENLLKKSLKNKNYYFLCAKYCNKVVGYASMYSTYFEGYICNILVHENFRNMKIATSIINKFIKYAQNYKLSFLTLEVRESNFKAINLYKNCGFKNMGIRKNFYKLPTENAIIMTYYLN